MSCIKLAQRSKQNKNLHNIPKVSGYKNIKNNVT